MDIFDINIHEITKQYLDSIKAMKKLNLEMAGDFVAMAATLIQIKSKMLLPQYNDAGELLEEQDPRRDLVKRLLEYQMYQDSSQSLYKRNLLGRDVWARGEREQIDIKDDEVILEEENALYSLIALYRGAIKRMKKAVHRVAESLQSISDRIMELRHKLVVGQKTTFFELVEVGAQERKGRLLITFLSLLELAKIGLVHLFQSENYADIHVDTQGAINSDVISHVENYDSQAKANTGTQDIWLSEDDRKDDATGTAASTGTAATTVTDVMATEVLMGEGAQFSEQLSAQLPLAPQETIIEEAATDEDIAAEEAKYAEKDLV